MKAKSLMVSLIRHSSFGNSPFPPARLGSAGPLLDVGTYYFAGFGTILARPARVMTRTGVEMAKFQCRGDRRKNNELPKGYIRDLIGSRLDLVTDARQHRELGLMIGDRENSR